MKLADNDHAQSQLEALLVENYGLLLQDGLVRSIQERCATWEAETILGAVIRHLEDTTVVDGRIAGKYPPAVAQVLFQARRIEEEQRRKAGEEQFRQQVRQFESDNTYRQALGELPAPDDRVHRRSLKIRGEVEKAAAIRLALQQRFKLDWRERVANLLLMQTLTEAVGRDELLLPVAEALVVAEELWAQLTGTAPAQTPVVQNWYEPERAGRPGAELPEVPL